MNIPVAKKIGDYFKAADVEGLTQFMLRKELSKSLLKGAKNTREIVIGNLVNLLHNYRVTCASSSSPS